MFDMGFLYLSINWLYIEQKKLDISHFYTVKRGNGGKIKELSEILVENSTYSSTTNLKEKLYK